MALYYGDRLLTHDFVPAVSSRTIVPANPGDGSVHLGFFRLWGLYFRMAM